MIPIRSAEINCFFPSIPIVDLDVLCKHQAVANFLLLDVYFFFLTFAPYGETQSDAFFFMPDRIHEQRQNGGEAVLAVAPLDR